MSEYAADWFDNPHLAHGGTYGVRGPAGLVIATNPFKAGWEKAQKLAAEMNAPQNVDDSDEAPSQSQPLDAPSDAARAAE